MKDIVREFRPFSRKKADVMRLYDDGSVEYLRRGGVYQLDCDWYPYKGTPNNLTREFATTATYLNRLTVSVLEDQP